MEKDSGRVNITYSAAEQRELEAIRAKYLPKSAAKSSNLAQIKKLDAQVEGRAMAFGLTTGILSAAVFAVAILCFLEWRQMVWGLIAALLGLIGMFGAWPIYQVTLRKGREKAAPEILRLSETE